MVVVVVVVVVVAKGRGPRRRRRVGTPWLTASSAQLSRFYLYKYMHIIIQSVCRAKYLNRLPTILSD